MNREWSNYVMIAWNCSTFNILLFSSKIHCDNSTWRYNYCIKIESTFFYPENIHKWSHFLPPNHTLKLYPNKYYCHHQKGAIIRFRTQSYPQQLSVHSATLLTIYTVLLDLLGKWKCQSLCLSNVMVACVYLQKDWERGKLRLEN